MREPHGHVHRQRIAVPYECPVCFTRHRVTVARELAVAFGRGAVLDAAGCAAATAHRGVRLIRMPTTVLCHTIRGSG